MDIDNLLNIFRGEDIILVDLSWILYRSHYAFKDLTNNEGVNTGSYYGLTKTIMSLSKGYPDSLILLVDDGNPVERKELNESYKSNREKSVRFENKGYVVDCLIQYVPNVYRVYHPALEADDLLYSISKIHNYGNSFIIYTADKDLYQAIDDATVIATKMSRNKLITIGRFDEDYVKHFQDLFPYQIPYYRAVVGDASDNLPIIRPRFPSKIAMYFARNNVYFAGTVMIRAYQGVDTFTDKQNECLKEIYESEVYLNNLKIMLLDKVDDIPIIDKDKTSDEVFSVIQYLQLNQYYGWLGDV